MNFEQYLIQMREIQGKILSFIDDENENYDDFKKNFDTTEFFENRNNLNEFLRLLSKISKNHHRNPYFFDRIEYILNFFKDIIKSNFTDYEIFNIFKGNSRILLFLIKNDFLVIDDTIFNDFIVKKENLKILLFLIPDIEKFLTQKSRKINKEELLKNDPQNFEENRKIGENDSYICTLIRHDSIEEFITYINSINCSLNSLINESIYETNPLLIKNKKKLTIIKYAIFHGAIQIIKYLQTNGIDLDSSMWIYAIHSNNAEIVYLLEENKIEPKDNNYEECMQEAIKCHHNNIVNYFLCNVIKENDYEMKKIIVESSLRFYNYELFPNSFDKKLINNIIKYNYINIVDILLKNNDIDLNEEVYIFLKNVFSK